MSMTPKFLKGGEGEPGSPRGADSMLHWGDRRELGLAGAGVSVGQW